MKITKEQISRLWRLDVLSNEEILLLAKEFGFKRKTKNFKEELSVIREFVVNWQLHPKIAKNYKSKIT